MNSVLAICLVAAVVLAIADGQERCGLLRTCSEDQCCVRVGLTGVLNQCHDLGKEGAQCGRSCDCPCAGDLECIDKKCTSSSSTDSEMSTTESTTESVDSSSDNTGV